MRTKKPTTKVMSASEVRQHFAETVNEAAKGLSRTVIEKNGVPSAAFVSARDLALLEFYEAKREEDFKIVDEMRAAFADVDPEEIEREAIKAVAEARADIRKERERQQREVGHVA